MNRFELRPDLSGEHTTTLRELDVSDRSPTAGHFMAPQLGGYAGESAAPQLGRYRVVAVDRVAGYGAPVIGRLETGPLM
jgi:hypothetical protein